MKKFNEVEVEPGEWRFLGGAGRISTAGLATCLGVAVYSLPERIAILGHFRESDLRGSDSVFDNMLEAIDQLEIKKGSHAWMGGAGLLIAEVLPPGISPRDMDAANTETMHMREEARERLLNVVSPRLNWVTTQWLFENRGSAGYSIDVATGNATTSWRP